MAQPYHIIATPDENGGYNVTIPENPNVSAHCADTADIIPSAVAAREKHEQKTAVCPKCGKAYGGHPALSRADGVTSICPDCGTREALDAVKMDKAEQDKIIEEIHRAAGL